jgi:hypothetical protein
VATETMQPAQDIRDRTIVEGQTGQDSRDRMVRTGQPRHRPRQVGLTGQPRQDRHSFGPKVSVTTAGKIARLYFRYIATLMLRA